MMEHQRVFAWELNDVAYCELKLALTQTHGDVRTPERERGRRIRADLKSAIAASPMPRLDGFEEAVRRHSNGSTIVFSKPLLVSEDLGLEARPNLVVWGTELHLFELKTEPPPRQPCRLLSTKAWESDAAQALAYGLVVEQQFKVPPRLWVIYAREQFVEKVKLAASKLADDGATLLQTLQNENPMEVPFSADNRKYILDRIERVRQIKLHPEQAQRSHERLGRCNACAYRVHCPDPLRDSAGLEA